MGRFGFASARPGEDVIYGAQRPGYNAKSVGKGPVDDWVTFMKEQGIRRVCCLLGPDQLAFYTPDLLEQYRKAFGKHNVLSAPVKDYHLCDRKTLHTKIIPFLVEADEAGEPTVVHCSGGSGRTGHILAAFLVRRRGLSANDALQAVVAAARNPYESVQCGNATNAQLCELLAAGGTGAQESNEDSEFRGHHS